MLQHVVKLYLTLTGCVEASLLLVWVIEVYSYN